MLGKNILLTTVCVLLGLGSARAEIKTEVSAGISAGFAGELRAEIFIENPAETPAEAALPKGVIRGRVVDALSGEPLTGTTIIIEGTTLGTIADAQGGFTISNITPGRVVITATYLGYEVFRQTVEVASGGAVDLEIPLEAEGIDIQDVVVVARVDNESENVQLSGQREALVAIQSVGAAEMSRKGIGNAQAAVAQVSGVSKQDGVKNVFVRGLGDRYNATFLNGFPLPSEDPEYKNIALEFFASDVIRNIGVNKVFSAQTGGDVGGAAIDIRSKELSGGKALSVSLDGGANSAAVGTGNFLTPDGVSYFGVSRDSRPAAGKFEFVNKLNSVKVALPLNHSYGVSGGKRWLLGESSNPLNFFVVASHSTDYSHTSESIRNATSSGNIYQDLNGEKSTAKISQLVLGNASYNIQRRFYFEYNFLMLHANKQYVAEYTGFDPRYADGEDERGWTRRQQSNDNLLTTNQLMGRFNLSDRWRVNAGAAYNTILGKEPDRRENSMSLQSDGLYIATGSNRQRRFFSELRESDLNLQASVSYKLKEDLDIERSNVTIGYKGRMVKDEFDSTEFNYGAYGSGSQHFPVPTDLDVLYNANNVSDDSNAPLGTFYMPGSTITESYNVSKAIHSTYVEATHRFSDRFAANAGVRADVVNMDVKNRSKNREIDTLHWLPSVSLRFDPTEKHSIRLGASKSYTLPQSKEISDYQYVDISFTSQGNINLRSSDNYNVDLKWDWYPSSSELVSLGTFYKYIVNPIGRVDQGNSAGMLTYDNLSDRADVAGVELEVRKNIINTTTIRENMRRLSVGFNASYIHSALDLNIKSTPTRRSQLEGASPWLINGDVSYNYSSGKRSFNMSIVANWFSDRIYTLGTRGYNDIIEEQTLNLSIVSSLKLNDRWTIKLKAGNLLNPKHRLTRKTGNEKIMMNEFRKGVDASVGLSFNLW